ncbi:MAG: hypothetical protein MJE77_04050 [Proteobacteria bacterium]|nr:hypothetical protein [Pseudomonadota bacterium]
MTTTDDRRRAPRVILNAPTVVRPVGRAEVELHPDLRRIYQRVEGNSERIGESFPAVVRDVSASGAFIAGEALPLLTRVAFSFELDDHGTVEAIAWTLWRRQETCRIPGPDGRRIELPKGIGVLFEAIPLESRIAIHNFVVDRSK